MKKVPKSVSEYMATIGAKGGAKGKGKRKIRDPEHYRRMGLASGRARRAKAEAKNVVDT